MAGIFKLTRGSFKLIGIMTVIVLIGFGIAFIYYNGINKSEDPRVVDAKLKYERYSILAEANDVEGVMRVLDSIEMIYTQFDDYEESYEVGVVYNNRCAVYLTQALYNSENDSIKDDFLNLAKENVVVGIEIYENWMDEFGEMSENDLLEYVKPIYTAENTVFDANNLENYQKKRVKELIIAQKETPRRLSVGYTNLGIILRHQLDLDSAIVCYTTALELWPQNLSAENNLNVLLGKPTRKPNLIQRLFPKEK